MQVRRQGRVPVGQRVLGHRGIVLPSVEETDAPTASGPVPESSTMCVRRLALVVIVGASVSVTGCLRDEPAVHITGQPAPPVTSTTPPPPKAVEVAPPKPLVLPEPGTVAVRTPSGVLALWLGPDGDGARVLTPCSRVAYVSRFTLVAPVDVVLDPGHGGLDPGAVASTGVSEADLNLDVALRVRDVLRARGVTAELTRDADYFRTIADRAELAAAIQPRAFVSIHHNGGTHPPAGLGPGTEAYHERDDPDSKRLAGVLWEEVVAGLARFDIDWVASQYRGALWRADRDGDDFYGVLRRADTMPAVILESAYLSGEAEGQLMLTDEFRAAEAGAIANGIDRWLSSPDTGTGYLDGFTLGGSARTFDMSACDDPPLE
jgi:N-acetylmuramoyl-L-alanine amidase